MKTIFMGTPDFAVTCLEALAGVADVAAVFTQSDKKAGRRRLLKQPPVKEFAIEHGISVYQPQSLKDSAVADIINKINPDLIVVVAYGKILPGSILNAPKYGCVNVHASLLPKYRGASPIQHAILNGETETGVTVMQMDSGIDTGDILHVEKLEIGENETTPQLFERLAHLGAKALIKTIEMIESGALRPKAQPCGEESYAPVLTKDDGVIDFSKSAIELHNQIRALQPWPGCTMVINGKNVKIIKAVISDKTGKLKGEVVSSKKTLTVCCGDLKCIDILEVQPEGKNKMPIAAYLAGNKIEQGVCL
ncbi:MAG: methionyl-tRNA formyltransferase [Clostridiales bacterium]|nr:methionyl-tRNA formyltransferase [Clostridiales bacterium]